MLHEGREHGKMCFSSCLFFSFPSHLFPQPSLAQTVLLGSLQAHEEHDYGQKLRAHADAYEGRGSRLKGGGPAPSSACMQYETGLLRGYVTGETPGTYHFHDE